LEYPGAAESPEELPVELQAVELRAVELRAVELRVVELRVVELRVVELRVVELQAVELRVVELQAVELRAVELQAVELRAVESPVLFFPGWLFFDTHAVLPHYYAIRFRLEGLLHLLLFANENWQARPPAAGPSFPWLIFHLPKPLPARALHP